MLSAQTDLLPKKFRDEAFDFNGRKLRGAKEQRARWKQCSAAVDGDLGEALGQKYVEATFGADGKERMLRMVHLLEQALKEDISGLPWMTDTTKKRALEKLALIDNKIGYPDKYRDYAAIKVSRTDPVGNSFRANEFEFQRQLSKIGQPVDKQEWGMTPPTVNAYYNPLMNNINFPAGILQPPFFDKGADDALNFGAIGLVIGHELTHGFDDEGSQFDGQGNLNDWWSKEDKEEFEKRTSCMADQYSGYKATPDTNLNGKLTLGENAADNGGARIAYMALHDSLMGKPGPMVDGFTADQRFFLGFANVWCQNATEKTARLRALTDPHSPGKWRVNGTVSNMPEFSEAFHCKPGDAMVRKDACRVW
jgi:endothelin-converting enzyme/putative endopeptidase